LNILDRFTEVQEKGQNQWQCRCPAHEDNKASLSVHRNESGKKWAVHCHAGCTVRDVLACVNLTVRDLYDDMDDRQSDIKYPYANENGEVLYFAVRKPGKQFRQQAADGTWKVKHIRKVPYKLPQLLESMGTVWICEGEKDCDTLERHGLTATCNVGGAGKWKAEFSAFLDGRDVVIIPDNDEPGHAHARLVSDCTIGVANSVKILDLKVDKKGGDVSDWLERGGEIRQLIELAGQLEPIRPIQIEEPSPVEETNGRLNGEISPPGSPPFPDIEFPGFIEGVLQYNRESSFFYQHQLAIGAAIGLMGALMGRKVQGDTGLRTNIYIVGTAPTTSGKEMSREINKLIAHASDSDICGPEQFGSGAGIVSWVAKTPSILFQLDEMGEMIAAISKNQAPQYLKDINQNLLSFYSASRTKWIGKAYGDTEKTPEIVQPCASVYGTTTEEGLWGSVRSKEISGGLLGRFLVFEGKLQRKTNRGSQIEVPQNLIDFMRIWHDYDTGGEELQEFTPNPPKANTTPEAAERQWKHFEDIHSKRLKEEDRDQNSRSALWGRTNEKARKLALMFAASRQGVRDFTVELEDVERAIRLSNWSTRKMFYEAEKRVADSEFEDQKKKALQYIRQNGQVTRRQFVRKFGSWDPIRRTQVLSDLVEYEGLREEASRGRGRPSVIMTLDSEDR